MGKLVSNDHATWSVHAEGRGAPARGTHTLPGGSQDFSKNKGGPGREQSSGKGARVSAACPQADSVTVLTQGMGWTRETLWGLGLALMMRMCQHSMRFLVTVCLKTPFIQREGLPILRGQRKNRHSLPQGYVVFFFEESVTLSAKG